jgi:competence protein ComEC
MLLYNPLVLFDIGFQLSFVAVVSIVVIHPLLVRLYTAKQKVIKYLWELTAVSVSAQAGVLPLSLYYFHQFPTFFLLTNLLLIPLAGVIMLFIPVTLLMHWLFGFYPWMAFPLQSLLSVFIWLTQSLAQIPGGSITAIHLDIFDTFLLYIALGFLVYTFIRKK